MFLARLVLERRGEHPTNENRYDPVVETLTTFSVQSNISFQPLVILGASEPKLTKVQASVSVIYSLSAK